MPTTRLLTVYTYIEQVSTYPGDDNEVQVKQVEHIWGWLGSVYSTWPGDQSPVQEPSWTKKFDRHDWKPCLPAPYEMGPLVSL